MTSLLQRRWILVVEDEALIALDIAAAFQDAGSYVGTAFSLEQALTFLELQPWAGAVLDYALCGHECTPLCERLVARRVPFIVSSGYETVSEPCTHGIHVPKPASVEEIVDTMNALVSEKLTCDRLQSL